MDEGLNSLQPFRYIGERVVWGSMTYLDISGMDTDFHLVIRIFVDDDLHSFRFFNNGRYIHTAWDVKGSIPEEAYGNFKAFDSLNWNWEERLQLRGEQFL